MFLSHRSNPWLILLRKSHNQAGLETNYYKILGISPSASQAEIKSAYFELSKKHHPDKNRGSEESARIFRLVKTAYEVLGSEKKRLQYDKDRIFKVVRKPVNYNSQNYPDFKDSAEKRHYWSRERQPFKTSFHGKTSFYDFDAWYDGHYGKTHEEYKIKFKAPRQFRSNPEPEIMQSAVNFFKNIKNIVSMIFYMLLVLSALKISSTPKKRNSEEKEMQQKTEEVK